MTTNLVNDTHSQDDALGRRAATPEQVIADLQAELDEARAAFKKATAKKK